MFCSFVDANGRPYLSTPTTLVRLPLNISIHSYRRHCGKEFCLYFAANCRWISAPFIPSGTKICTIACYLSVVQTSSGAVIFTPCSLGTNGLQLNHTLSMLPLTLSYSMARPQQCCQLYNEAIPILTLLFESLRTFAGTVELLDTIW
jgi:hypothetical protein